MRKNFSQRETEKTVEAWSDLARQTGVELDPGDPGRRPPNLSGTYRYRRVYASTVFQMDVSNDLGVSSIPCINMWLEVENTGRCRLDAGWKGALDLRARSDRSREENFDGCFSATGYPDDFLRRVRQLSIRTAGIHGAALNTPSIELKGGQLISLQRDTIRPVPGQLSLLNLLCDLAELAEEYGPGTTVVGTSPLAASGPARNKKRPVRSWVGMALFVLLPVALFLVFGARFQPAIAGFLHWALGAVILMGIMFKILDDRERREYQRLTTTWSELARQIGLEFEAGDPGAFNQAPRAPIITGTYRGRRVSIKKGREGVLSGEVRANDPGAFTCMSLEVEKGNRCRLLVDPDGELGGASSGDEEFDRCFRFEGHPDSLVREALQLITRHRSLLYRPEGIMRLTDNWGAAKRWKPPSINLGGSRLVCVQWGLPTRIPGQISLLDLLCDLADLAERPRSD